MKNLFYRSLELDRSKVDEKTRSVPVSFSSEMPVQRWFGNEILLHDKKNVDLSRLRSMGAALLNHNPGVIVGPLKDVRLEEKRGKATIVFDDDEDGERAFRKVKSGSLKGMSVGYLINKAREVLKDEEYEGIKGPAFIALRWTPYEISLTPIPADASVGVGRSLEHIEIENSIHKEGNQMTEEQIRELVRSIMAQATDGFKKEFQDFKREIAEAGKPKMRVDEEIGLNLLGRAGAISPDLKGQVGELILAGKTEREIADIIMAAVPSGSDAGDTPGSQADGGIDNAKQITTARITSLKQVDDETLWRSISDPALLALN